MSDKGDKELHALVQALAALADGLAQHGDKVGALSGEKAAIEALGSEIERLNAEQERLKAETEAATQALYEAIEEGERKRSQMHLLLRGTLGADSQLLESFGIKVR